MVLVWMQEVMGILPAGKAEPRDRAGASGSTHPPAGQMGWSSSHGRCCYPLAAAGSPFPSWFPGSAGSIYLPPASSFRRDPAQGGTRIPRAASFPCAYISPVPPSFHQQLGGLGWQGAVLGFIFCSQGAAYPNEPPQAPLSTGMLWGRFLEVRPELDQAAHGQIQHKCQQVGANLGGAAAPAEPGQREPINPSRRWKPALGSQHVVWSRPRAEPGAGAGQREH